MKQSAPPKKQWLIEVLQFMAIAVIYYLTIRVGLLFVVRPEGMAAIWPPSGVALAAFLITKKQRWPIILTIIFLVNLVGNINSGNSFLLSLGFGAANILEVALASFFITHFFKEKVTFATRKEIILLFLAAVVCNGLTAAVGAAVAHLALGAPFISSWYVWWVSDGLGILVVAPFVVAFVNKADSIKELSLLKIIEGIILIAVLVLFTLIILKPAIMAQEQFIQIYLIFPLMIWGAIRFKIHGISSLILIFTITLFWDLTGSFQTEAMTLSMIKPLLMYLQTLVAVIAFSFLLLAVVTVEHQTAQNELRKSKENFERLFETTEVSIWNEDLTEIIKTMEKLRREGVTDLREYLSAGDKRAAWELAAMVNVKHVNKATLKMFGVAEEKEFLESIDTSFGPGAIDVFIDEQCAIWSGAAYYRGEAQFRKIDGTDFTGIITFNIPGTMEGFKSVAVSIFDITDRKQAEKQLREREARYKGILQAAMDGYWLVDMEGNILSVNESYCRMSGYSEAEVLSKKISDFEVCESLSETLFHVEKVMKIGFDRFESRHRRKDGSSYPVEVSVQHLPAAAGCLFAFLRDITLQKESEEDLRRSLEEKNILLRELYHRTKNNMQVISSLLKLQSLYTAIPEVKAQLLDAESRIGAMALVHKKLYQSKSLSRIPLRDYVTELVGLLFDSYRVNKAAVSIEITVEDVIVMLDTAVPVGLILNELISNSLKYAFPDSGGTIFVAIAGHEKESVIITVRDNGIGIPEDLDLYNSNTLGLQTVINIVENQLSGNISFESENGFTSIITFKNVVNKDCCH